MIIKFQYVKEKLNLKILLIGLVSSTDARQVFMSVILEDNSDNTV